MKVPLFLLSLLFLLGILFCRPCHATEWVVTSDRDSSDPPNLTLREAIFRAQNADVITFDPSLDGRIIGLLQGPLLVDKNISITAASLPTGVVISGFSSPASSMRVSADAAISKLRFIDSRVNYSAVEVYTGGRITMNNCRVENATNGAIWSQGAVRLNDCVITGCASGAPGGVSAVQSNFETSSLSMVRTVITNNRTSMTGTTIFAHGTTLIEDCTITDNLGQVIRLWDGQLILRNTNISNNHDTYSSIVLDLGFDVDCEIDNCTMTNNRGDYVPIRCSAAMRMTNTTISRNVSTSLGSAIDHGRGSLFIDNCRILDNTPLTALRIGSSQNPVTIRHTIISGSGLGILSANDHASQPVVIEDCQITNNRGGGINHAGGPFQMTRCLLADNGTFVTSSSGGVNLSCARVDIVDCRILNNRSQGYAAGLSLSRHNLGSQATIDRSTIANNVSIHSSGGLELFNLSSLTVRNSTFFENEGKWGGAINMSSSQSSAITLDHCTLSSNHALARDSIGGVGGAIYFQAVSERSTLHLLACTIANNRAQRRGGGLFVSPSPLAECRSGNCIFAANTDDSTVAPDVSGSLVSQGYNLVGQMDGSDGWILTDLTGDSSEPLAPGLMPLANYGGPTFTHALMSTSPALNVGDPVLARLPDQRGVPRDNTPDIGAYEYRKIFVPVPSPVP